MVDLDEFYSNLGKKIQQERGRLKKTQEQLADYLDLNRTSVTNIEKGKQRILLHTFLQIADFLEMEPNDLIPVSEGPRKAKKLSNMVPTEASDIQRMFASLVLDSTKGDSKNNESSPQADRKSR